MITLLMVAFVFLCFGIVLFVLLQQGKGDMGLGSLAGSQALFGGSGGREFFERATWVMLILFVLGSLGLTILKTRAAQSSQIAGYKKEHIPSTSQALPPTQSSTHEPAEKDVEPVQRDREATE